MTEIDNDGIIVEAQDLTTLNPGSDDDKRLYNHDGSSALSLTDGSTTTTQGYYLWNASLSGWIAASDDIVDNQDINPTTVGTETTYFDSVDVPTDSEYESGEIAVFNNGGELYKRPYGGVESPVGSGGTASGIVDVKTDLGVEPGDGQDLGQVLDDYVVNELGGASNLNHEFRLMNGTYTFKTGCSFQNVQHFGLVGERDTVIDVAADVEEDILDPDDGGNGRLGRCFYITGSSFQMNNLTFDMNGTVGEFNIDASIVSFKIDDEAYVTDIDMVGKRDKWQYTTDGSGNTVAKEFGARISYLFQITSKDGQGYYQNVHYNGEPYSDKDPDGTGSPQFDPTHAIGISADPQHVGSNTFVNCSAVDAADNGFYTVNSPGSNLLLNCYARDNSVANFRPGSGDQLIGGMTEWTTDSDTTGYRGSLIRVENTGGFNDPHNGIGGTLVDSMTVKCKNGDPGRPAIHVHPKTSPNNSDPNIDENFHPVQRVMFRNLDVELNTDYQSFSIGSMDQADEEHGRVVIEGCSVVDTGINDTKAGSVEVDRKNVVIRDCDFSTGEKGPIYIPGYSGVADVSIENTRIKSDESVSPSCIYARTCDRISVKDCTLIGGSGVYNYSGETVQSVLVGDSSTSGLSGSEINVNGTVNHQATRGNY